MRTAPVGDIDDARVEQIKICQNTSEQWAANRKSCVLAMFLVCKMAKGDSIKDGIAFIDGLDGNVDGVYRGVFVYLEFGNEASASPQIWNIARYAFYFCMDGPVADDNANVDVMAPTDIVEQSVDGDRRTALASLGRITENAEHPRSRKRWYLEEGRSGIHFNPFHENYRGSLLDLKNIHGVKKNRHRLTLTLDAE